MRERRQTDWPTVACQVDAEEWLVTSAPEVPAEGARAIIRELFASGRVPPTPEGRGAVAISLVRRLWLGTQPEPSGVHILAIVGDRCSSAARCPHSLLLVEPSLAAVGGLDHGTVRLTPEAQS